MVANGFLDSNLMFVLAGTWFMLSRNDNGHTNRYWCSENPHAVHDVQLYDSRVGVGCVMRVRKITGPVIFKERISSYHCVQL